MNSEIKKVTGTVILLTVFTMFLCFAVAHAGTLHAQRHVPEAKYSQVDRVHRHIPMKELKNDVVEHEPKYKIGIIDTGYDESLAQSSLKICKHGSFDFAKNQEGVGSANIHGTIVGSIIAEQLQDVDYCAEIFQVVGEDGKISVTNIIKALDKASHDGLLAVNISLEGNGYAFTEYAALSALTSKGTAIFVAAGNENKDLNQTCNAFPACYQLTKLYAVGALAPNYEAKEQYSNYGRKVVLWYQGEYMFMGGLARGTSFASPLALSDYISSLARLQH